jgi:hypothetical protein
MELNKTIHDLKLEVLTIKKKRKENEKCTRSEFKTSRKSRTQ